MSLHDDALIETARLIRIAEGPAFTLAPMSSAPLEEPFKAILNVTAEEVEAEFYDVRHGARIFMVAGEQRFEDEFQGWCKPAGEPEAIDVPLIAEGEWPEAWRRFDEHCEDEANDRASGREWL